MRCCTHRCVAVIACARAGGRRASAAAGAAWRAGDPGRRATTGAELAAEPRPRRSTATMPRDHGARKRMEMRFDLLQQRRRATSARAWRVPSFGAWVRSQPGRAGLRRPASASSGSPRRPSTARIVRFRWRDARGASSRRAKRCSRASARSPTRAPTSRVGKRRPRRRAPRPGTARYDVVVRNAGPRDVRVALRRSALATPAPTPPVGAERSSRSRRARRAGDASRSPARRARRGRARCDVDRRRRRARGRRPADRASPTRPPGPARLH